MLVIKAERNSGYGDGKGVRRGKEKDKKGSISNDKEKVCFIRNCVRKAQT